MGAIEDLAVIEDERLEGRAWRGVHVAQNLLDHALSRQPELVGVRKLPEHRADVVRRRALDQMQGDLCHGGAAIREPAFSEAPQASAVDPTHAVVVVVVTVGLHHC